MYKRSKRWHQKTCGLSVPFLLHCAIFLVLPHFILCYIVLLPFHIMLFTLCSLVLSFLCNLYQPCASLWYVLCATLRRSVFGKHPAIPPLHACPVHRRTLLLCPSMENFIIARVKGTVSRDFGRCSLTKISLNLILTVSDKIFDFEVLTYCC